MTIVNQQLHRKVEVGCLRHPLVSTIGGQLRDEDHSMDDIACKQAPCESGKKFGERSVNLAAKHVGVGE